MPTEIETLQKAGANARALGLSVFDNPYYRPVNMPAVTREPIEDWSAKELAWRAGWEIENAMRSGGAPIERDRQR